MLVSYPRATQFSRRFIRGYDRDTGSSCDSSHWGKVGREGRREGRGHPMTTQPIRPQSAGSSSHWYTNSATCNRFFLLAGSPAGLIALALLAILALIVWF